MIKRQRYLDKINKELLDLDRILFVIWARQVGKTTLLKALIEFWYIPKEQTYGISWDTIMRNTFYNGDDLLDYVKTFTSLEHLHYLIIDEAQYIQNIGIILKTLVDDVRAGKKHIKIIVSGSGSLNVFKGISDTLTGRKKTIQIFPFDFVEFCLAKGISDFDPKPASLSIYQNLFQEYIRYGWYPKVVLTDDPQIKQDIFVSLLNDYLFKDIALLLAEKDILKLKTCLQTIATYVCSPIKISTLSQQIGISRYTLEKYFFILENTFLFHSLSAFVWSKAPWEIKKLQKLYCQDIGMLRFLLWLSSWEWSFKGKVIENFVANTLMNYKQDTQDLYFWRTKSWAEVDFVLKNNFDNSLSSIEAKNTDIAKISRGYQSFVETYKEQISELYCTTTNVWETQAIGNNTSMHFLPYISLPKVLLNKISAV